jgi:fumarate reductase flavoprotein subunit
MPSRGPWNEEADLVIVGASAAGLTAAIIAADRGCRTVVVERGKELGGSVGNDSALIAAAGSRFQQAARIEDTPSRLVTDIEAATRHHVEPALAQALAEQGAPLVAWLADRCGAQVELLTAHRAGGHSAVRLHAPGERGGTSLSADLVRAASHHSHISIRTGTTVERLVRDEGGTVTGVAVRAERRGAPQALGGRVLLACGGFAADDALVAEHCPAVADLPYQGSARAVGDGLRLGLGVNAQTRHMGSCLVTPFLAMPGQVTVSVPLVELGAILVNQAGRRFADETSELLPLALAVRAQPGRMAYLLFDERIADAARAADPFFARIVLPRTGRRGATLEALAKQFEIDSEGVRLSVDTFNGNAELGGDPFGRTSTGAALAEPFHAIRVTGARSRSLGGLAVDARARVLDAENQPIPGLYAAGGTAASLGGDGTEGLLAGTRTLTGLGLARLAALDVVSQTAHTEPE